MHFLSPQDIAAPLARYSHGVVIPAGSRLLRTAGQLGLRADGTVPDDVIGQATVCFDIVEKILRADGMTAANVIHISAYLLDRADMRGYMTVRDAFIGDDRLPPTSTLLIVSGFSRPECRVEVEVWAASPP